MPMFVTIGYGDQEGYDRTDATARERTHAHDAALRGEGVVMGVAGSPVQVRNPDARGVQRVSGPFLQSALPLAGFSLIEAVDLDAAVDLASHAPCAVNHGVVEVWPLEPTAGNT